MVAEDIEKIKQRILSFKNNDSGQTDTEKAEMLRTLYKDNNKIIEYINLLFTPQSAGKRKRTKKTKKTKKAKKTKKTKKNSKK